MSSFHLRKKEKQNTIKMMTESDPMQSLTCFKTKELFNINTNALFVKKKEKDPLLSDDDSEDDEDAIQEILRDDFDSKQAKQKIETINIDVNSFDMSKPIEHNIRNLRQLI